MTPAEDLFVLDKTSQRILFHSADEGSVGKFLVLMMIQHRRDRVDFQILRKIPIEQQRRLFANAEGIKSFASTVDVPGKILLTKREKEVLSLAVTGKSNKEIASSINLSESTIKFHMTSLLRKFQVRKRIELISATDEDSS